MSLQMGIRTRAQDTGDVDRALGEPVGGWEELRLPAVLKVSVEVPRGLCCHSCHSQATGPSRPQSALFIVSIGVVSAPSLGPWLCLPVLPWCACGQPR